MEERLSALFELKIEKVQQEMREEMEKQRSREWVEKSGD
jgi:hypothetical protein